MTAVLSSTGTEHSLLHRSFCWVALVQHMTTFTYERGRKQMYVTFSYTLRTVQLIQKMIKMRTCKGTEEQPRMQANDVNSLKYETQVYWLYALKGQETMTNTVVISNCSPQTEFPTKRNQASLEKCLIFGLGKDCTR